MHGFEISFRLKLFVINSFLPYNLIQSTKSWTEIFFYYINKTMS